MRFRVWLGFGLLALGASLGAPAWGEADDDQFEKAATTVNSAATTSAGLQQVAGKIASQLNATCKCSDFSAASVTAQRAQTGWGWGNVLIADEFALAIMKQQKISFAEALEIVSNQRQQGMGWGAIGHAHGLNVGKLISGTVRSANAVANAENKTARGQTQANAPGAGLHGRGQGAGQGGGHGGDVGAGHGAVGKGDADQGQGGGGKGGGGQGADGGGGGGAGGSGKK